jgi:CheY-like chemotaxis protein
MKSVLVAEDDPLVVAVLVGILEDEVEELIEVGSGTEALQLLAERPFDCVISDLKMPGASGLEVLGRARALSPHVRLVLISGYADETTEKEARAIDAALLHKPFGVEEFRLAAGSWRSDTS